MYQRLIGLLEQSSARAGKSVINAYRRVVDAKTDGEKMHSQTMNQFTEQMGSLIKTPMTREEALKILNIELAEEADAEAKDIMARFDTLFEKNQPERGGSFYIQSKVYFAKEFLMQDHPENENVSKFNPEGQLRPEESD